MTGHAGLAASQGEKDAFGKSLANLIVQDHRNLADLLFTGKSGGSDKPQQIRRAEILDFKLGPGRDR
jgi:hypothetical protein